MHFQRGFRENWIRNPLEQGNHQQYSIWGRHGHLCRKPTRTARIHIQNHTKKPTVRLDINRNKRKFMVISKEKANNERATKYTYLERSLSGNSGSDWKGKIYLYQNEKSMYKSSYIVDHQNKTFSLLCSLFFYGVEAWTWVWNVPVLQNIKNILDGSCDKQQSSQKVSVKIRNFDTWNRLLQTILQGKVMGKRSVSRSSDPGLGWVLRNCFGQQWIGSE